ncbi:MAG: alpha/beta hydrolase [Bacillota bacterium]
MVFESTVKQRTDQAKKRAKVWLCISIALMLISMVVASIIQTSAGNVTIKELYWETDQGIALSANLYVPRNATSETPAPAIVTSHGLFNNKEMQDANCIELSRRGFVVVAPDQPRHGKSDLIGTDGTYMSANNAVYLSALMVSRLPYVDASRIGVTGHSMGGMSCNTAVMQDSDPEKRLISAVLINCADATYTDSSFGLSDETTGNYVNIYGNRDVGMIAVMYDEFFHKSKDEYGNQLQAPYFMKTANAQSFLHFGKDPAGLETRKPDTMYRETVDGKECIRVIYRPPIIHPWSHFSARATAAVVEFFQETLGAPNQLAPSNQVWFVKELFNFIGLIGFALFIVNFTILMLYTPYFSALRSEEIVQPMAIDNKGKAWFWGLLIAAALFAMIVYLPIISYTFNTTIVKQTETFAIGCWAAACGIFSIVCMYLFYRFYGKKQGFDLAERGVKMPLPKLAKTLLLAIIVVVVAYSCVFFADYFFQTDFRIWTLAFKAFNPNLLFTSLFPYMILYLIFYVASSVSANSFNYNQAGGKRIWVNDLIVSVFAAVPAIIMLSVQYITYFTTNSMAWPQLSFGGPNPPMYILWLFPFLLILPGTTAISRAIYRVSNNPYLGGIINAVIITLFACTNTITGSIF